ncbi:MAG: hypothetical protein K8L91_23825 [Anaerolineae bacterium]|nr:hypothetical protein [Anaerolineae bacterium]
MERWTLIAIIRPQQLVNVIFKGPTQFGNPTPVNLHGLEIICNLFIHPAAKEIVVTMIETIIFHPTTSAIGIGHGAA